MEAEANSAGPASNRGAMDQPSLTGLKAYLLAAGCVALAFVLRLVLDPVWGERLPYVSFFLGVLLVARYTGTGPVLATAGAGFFLADWFFIAPRHSLVIQDEANWVSTGFFFFLSIIVVVLSRRTRLALARERDAHLRLREHVEALRESEERYASIVENCRDAILLTDSKGKVLAANREACQIFGRTEEELRRLDRHTLIDPADTLAAEIAVAERARTGKARFELTFLRADGSKFTGEVSSAVFRDRHGVARNSSIIRDITDRKRAEQELARLAAVVASSEDAIIGKSLDGTISIWNAAAERLYGYTAAEAIGRSVGMLMPPERDAELLPLLERVGRGEQIQHFETIRRTRDGRLVEVSLSISPVRDTAGRIVGASTIARDITERRKAEREREQLVGRLQAALREVKTLSGLLPICSHCKKIRDDQGYWNQIELYIRARSNADFTHSICPDCAQKLYPDLYPDNQPNPAR
jgi:PAS domain S-box-containing protein